MIDILETMREFAKFAETKSEREAFEAVINEITTLRARLAPVCDIKLSQIGSEAIYKMKLDFAIDREANEEPYEMIGDPLSYVSESDAVIDAIRSHIEAAEREKCAAALEITSDEIRLHAGEMTAQEMRSVLAVLMWRAAAIRRGK